MIKLGDKVKDKISGFTGIAVSRIEYINGCIQYGVKPRVKKNGEMPDIQYIDEKQLSIISKKVRIKKERTGGPQSDAPKKSII